MAYLSLYRKYRPQFFADVAGQDHVVQTLQNALKSGHVANGYLFCGTRGVAKTTLARILAKGLNCLGPDGNATVPQYEPCNVCAACKAITAGQAVDVVELDAASNRSVNDIAKLRESVQFGPMENRYKVYIVDEAHQLSSDAKDAFLKTLEEPPANVVFILATTETHAIPITIASRCQRFDFKRGSISQISKQVRRVLSSEAVTMDDNAINQIARGADGSYRDALSLLDQVLAFKRQNITGDDVAEVLGTVKNDLLATTVQKIAESDFSGVFSVSEEIFNQGKDVRQFLKSLAGRFRDMLFLSSGAKQSDSDQQLNDPIIRQQASQFSPTSMMDALTIITEAERETRNNNQHRLLLEMALLKLTKLPATPIAIEWTPQSIVASGIPGAQETPIIGDNSTTETVAIDSDVDDLELLAVRQEEAELEEARGDLSEEIDRLTIPMFGTDNEPAKLPPISAFRPSEPSQTALVESEQRDLISSSLGGNSGELEPEPLAVVPDELQYLTQHWSEAVNHMGVVSRGGVPLMNDAKPIAQNGNVITLQFTHSSFVAKLESPRAMDRLQEVINKVLKKAPNTIKIRPVLAGDATQVGPSMSSKSGGALPNSQTEVDETPSDLLDEVISVFGGRIIDDGVEGQ